VPNVDAVLLSDYKSGVVSPRVVDACYRLATKHQKLLTVDSQGDLHRSATGWRRSIRSCSQWIPRGTFTGSRGLG